MLILNLAKNFKNKSRYGHDWWWNLNFVNFIHDQGKKKQK
jgi:hypothetical protein